MHLRHVRRLRAIARVLARHGLGPYLQGLGLPRPARGRGAAPASSWPERVRLALQELGPTFIKLGQLAAARPDLIPAEYAAALHALRDEVPPAPFPRIRAEVEAALGRPLTDVFTTFAEEPLAAASIGQVHPARLRDGSDVLVKVRRPGVAEDVRADLELLAELVRRAEPRFPALAAWQPSDLLAEFRRGLLRELDLRRELRHMQLFARAWAALPGIRIPRPYPEFSSERLLVMERLEGETVARARLERERGRALAQRLVRFLLLQVFERGFFHADLHPGNVLVLPDGGLGILDFGQVGWLDEETRAALAGLLVAFVERDYAALADGLLALAAPATGPTPDPAELRRDLMEVVEVHRPERLSQLALRPLLTDLLETARRHRLRLPRALAMLAKALAAAEGTLRQLDPDLAVEAAAVEFARERLRRGLSPARVLRRGRRTLRELEALLTEGPHRVRAILRKMEEGSLTVEFKHVGLQPVMERLGRIGTRLSASLVLAALLVGASLALQGGAGPRLLDIPVLAWLGYAVAVALGAWLLWTARAEGRE